MALSAAVQHHPGRSELLPPLLAALEPLRPDVAADPDPSGAPAAWRAYRVALERTPPWATHRLIVQDDAVCLPGFLAAAEASLAAKPDVVVCYFVGGQPTASALRCRQSLKKGLPWAAMNPQDWVPLIACAWPVEVAARFVAWVDSRRFEQRRLRSDDYLAGTFARLHRLPVWATVPSLVQHPDDSPSLIGRPHLAGANTGRVAAIWDPDIDLSAVAWDR